MLPFFRPEAIDLVGPLKIQPFGVMLAVGFILGSLWCQKYARRRGIDPKTYTDILFWLALGAMVFGHLGHVFYEPQSYLDDPVKIFKVWEGLSSFGGYFGCAATCVWFFRSRGIKPLRGGDVLMIGLMFGIFIGRLGCFMVHDHIGQEVDESHPIFQQTIGALAVEYPSLEEAAALGKERIEEGDLDARAWRNRGGSYRMCCPPGTDPARSCSCSSEDELYAIAGAWSKSYHPDAIGTVRYDLGLMDSLLGLLVFLVLITVARKPRREGLLLALTPMIYAPIRLVWDSLRNTDLDGSSDVRYFLDMTPGQIASVILFGLGVWVLWMSRSKPVWPGPEDRPWLPEGAPAGGGGKRKPKA
ncbi:MAG: prolipoprotein diacylglyceryl transferase family protein [Myxococcota bacterium]|nr:prolipoprotein diacylglyceryl transferase family protein [Myxococcota bacterium]